MKDLKLNSIKDLKNEGKSFYWASFFLPKKSKNNAGILYSICRYFDNIADKNNKDMSLFLKESIKKIKSDNKNEVNIFLKKNDINVLIFADLIRGLISDQKDVKIKNQTDLIKYSYFVAGTVGLMMSKILLVNDRRAFKGAIDLGIAMQLTNIARDVIEDKKMNREYIKPDFENIQATLKLADMFYESSFSSIQKIPFRYKFSIIVARRIYRQIGRKILQKRNMENYEKSGKIYVNNFEKIYHTIISIFDLILLYLKEIETHQRVKEHAIISQEIDLDERI